MIITWLQTILILSVAAYFIFDFFDGKRVHDEREELIRMKTYKFVQRTSSWSIVGLTFLYIFDRHQPAIIFLVAIVLASLYSEIAGKLYWRSKL